MRVPCTIPHPHHTKAKKRCHKRDRGIRCLGRMERDKRSIDSQQGMFMIQIAPLERAIGSYSSCSSSSCSGLASILKQIDNALPTEIESFHSTFCQMGSVSVYGTSIQIYEERNIGNPWVLRKSSSFARHIRPNLLTRRVVSKIWFG
jgi:hypothetical protein